MSRSAPPALSRADCNRYTALFHHVLSADPMRVRATLAALRGDLAARLPDDLLGRLELALAEALNNIVEHGDAHDQWGRIHLLVKGCSDGIACVIADRGALLPDICLGPGSLPPREPTLPEGGFGWYLIRALAAEINYERAGGRNYLAFTIPLHDKDRVAA